jgi:hypothetical protein
MHVLVAALLGGVLAFAAYLVVSRVTGTPITWKRSLAAFAGGAIGAFVAVALLPAGGFAAASLGESLSVAALSGASGGGSEQVLNNALTGRPLEEHLVESTLIAGGTAFLFRGGQELLGPRVPQAIREAGAGNITRTATDGVVRVGRKLVEHALKELGPASAGVGAVSHSSATPSATGGITGSLAHEP